jgi:type III restriction enzyme
VVLSRGEVIGDVSEKDLRRIQIRETIISHFEKEKHLFELGIKTLSLFFIDEVAKYRKYNEAGEEFNPNTEKCSSRSISAC